MHRFTSLLLIFVALFSVVEGRSRKRPMERYPYIAVGDTDISHAAVGLGFRAKGEYWGSDASYTFAVYPSGGDNWEWDLKVLALWYPATAGPYIGFGAGFYPNLPKDRNRMNNKEGANTWGNNLLLYGRAAIGYEWAGGRNTKRFIQLTGITKPTLVFGFGF